MLQHPNEISDAIESFVATHNVLTESNIASAITKACKGSAPSYEELPKHAQAEQIAFGFLERRLRDGTNDIIYFPMSTWTKDDGSPGEVPDTRQIDQEVLDYWTQRAKGTSSPLARTRYFGLVWQFSPAVFGSSAGVDVAHGYIDSVISLVRERIHRHPASMFQKLANALGLAIAIKDKHRQSSLTEAIIDLEKEVGDDENRGLWGNAFDLLIENKKVGLEPSREAEIITDLEERLERMANPPEGEPIDPWGAEAAAVRLARHYRQCNEPAEVKRVILRVGFAFDRLSDGADAMLAQAWAEQVHDLYRQFNLHTDAAEVRQKIHALGPDARKNMVPMETAIEVSKDDMDAHVARFTNDGLDEGINRLVAYYIPRRQETEKQLEELSSEYPLSFLMSTKMVDSEGRPIAQVGNLQDDRDGHVIQATVQHMSFVGIFVRRVIEGLISNCFLSTSEILSRLPDCPVIDSDRYSIIEQGLDFYFAQDWTAAIHLLVPQIESAIRCLARVRGASILKPNRQGGMDHRALDDLIRDDAVNSVLGDDVCEYLRIVLTDRRGLNIRNRAMHGLMSPGAFHAGVADRVFHCFLLLALLREQGDATES